MGVNPLDDFIIMENEITINNIKYFSEEKYLKDLLEIKEKLETLEKSQERRIMTFPTKSLSYTILIRNNSTNKHKCIRYDSPEIKSEKQLLELVKKLLTEHFEKGE